MIVTTLSFVDAMTIVDSLINITITSTDAMTSYRGDHPTKHGLIVITGTHGDAILITPVELQIA